MVTKDLQTLNLKFDQVLFNSLVLTWERNFEVTFGIFSVLVFQITVPESLDIYLFLKVVMKTHYRNGKDNPQYGRQCNYSRLNTVVTDLS